MRLRARRSGLIPAQAIFLWVAACSTERPTAERPSKVARPSIMPILLTGAVNSFCLPAILLRRAAEHLSSREVFSILNGRIQKQ